MEFRSSPYMDFNMGTILMHPMRLERSRALPRTVADMLDIFECRVEVWQLGPAVEILKQIEKQKPSSACIWAHSAYSLTLIIVGYFEMIGKSLNPRSNPTIDFNFGFCDVYPSFDVAGGGRTDHSLPDVKEFRDRVRNGLYHLGSTKDGLFLHNNHALTREDFFIDRTGRTGPSPTYLMNPHQVTRTIVAHFPEFVVRLRGSSDLQQRFRRYFEDAHAVRSSI